MKKHLFIILALILGITSLQAKPVEVGTAQRLGQSFVQHKAMFAKNAVKGLELAYTYHATNGMATAFVFNFDGGFVVVAADDCSSPILGYSDHGNFDYETAPDGLRYMLSVLSDDIERRVQLNHPVSNDIVCRWKNLEAYGVLHPERGAAVVGPLVQQRWDQGSPFNMYVPGGCPTGCVATAMAQLMKYWEWPVKGTGEHSYFAMGYGEQYANFGATTYDWANMIDYYGNGSITLEQKQAVATLMYHCGVSVDMMYEPSGSGAFSQDVPIAINTYFSYSEHATHIGRSGSYNDWIALLKTNIDQHIPVYYSGQSTDGGHAFVCDGYDVDDLFYFNWGWGGSSNGFFLIDGEDFEFSGSQAIVYDFVPNYVYNQMPKAPENLSVSIDSDVSRIGHLSWTNPTETVTGEALTSIDKVIIKRNGFVVQEIENVQPGQAMTYDDEVPFFDQFDYTVMAVRDEIYGRTTITKAVFGPYCDWKVIMTSTSMQGWDGGGITVQNAAGSYIDFLTTTTSSASMQTFPMSLGNNNLYWTEPNSAITNISFKIKDAENQLVYEYNGPSSGLEAGMLRTLNNSCGNENTCEAPYNLKATRDPDNDRNIILSWDSDHTPEFGYCIYRDGFLFNMAHELQYVDENTEIGGHCYYITALCNGGETEHSNEYCATSGSGCEPPLDLYFSYTNNNKVQLDWTVPENENVTGYYVYRKTADTPYKRIKILTQTTFKDNTSAAGTVYQYAVVAYYRDIDCFSAYANDLFDVDKFFVEVDWSSTPKNLQAELNEEETAVNLRWKPAFQATSYVVMRNGAEVAIVTDSEFVDEGIAPGETYCYTVTAMGADFEQPSNEACVTVSSPILPCSAPTNLRRVETAANPRVAWDAPEDRVPDSYIVVIINHISDETIEVEGITDLYYEEATPIGEIMEEMDKSYKVKAVYSDCESEFALTADGEDFVRIHIVPVLPCSAPKDLSREEVASMARIVWNAPEDRVPESYSVVIVDHISNETKVVENIAELFYEEPIPAEEMDKSYQVKAVYPECESDFALTANGEDFIRINNLSVAENPLLAVKLYPNPTSGQLTIEAKGMISIGVYNLVGQCMMERTSKNNSIVLNMSGLKEGVYFVKVNTAIGSVVKKVVKM